LQQELIHPDYDEESDDESSEEESDELDDESLEDESDGNKPKEGTSEIMQQGVPLKEKNEVLGKAPPGEQDQSVPSNSNDREVKAAEVQEEEREEEFDGGAETELDELEMSQEELVQPNCDKESSEEESDELDDESHEDESGGSKPKEGTSEIIEQGGPPPGHHKGLGEAPADEQEQSLPPNLNDREVKAAEEQKEEKDAVLDEGVETKQDELEISQEELVQPKCNEESSEE
jgi:hypothetical protein